MDYKDLKALEYDKMLEDMAIYAKTPQSKELCLNIKPENNVEQIKFLLSCTEEAYRILNCGLDIPIEHICNTKLITDRYEYYSPQELFDLAKTMRTSRLIKNFLKENSEFSFVFDNLKNNLYSNKTLEDKIFSSFDEKLEIKSDITPELSGLTSSLKDNEKNLKTKINELLNNPEFSKHLQEQIYTVRDDRIVFQVRASAKSKVPGIIHDVSATSKSFYIEPNQLIPLSNKIREIKLKINAEIVKILKTISKEINADANSLIDSINLIADLDMHFTKARYASKTDSVLPEISRDKRIKILDMRHPLLINRVENLVANDFNIGEGFDSLIITGSNTGGKTVALKTVGLLVLMFKSGMFLPCLKADLYPYEDVFADIGDEQNIFQNLSTFSSHMKNLIHIIESSNDKSLVLVDEICAGTDPLEGAILAEVILNKLSQNGATTVVTTHYGQLKALAYANDNFKNGCVEFDMNTLKPTYKLIIGVPGLSNAIAISSNLGLDKELIDTAYEMMNSQKDSSEVLLEKLQYTQHELNKELTNAEIQNKEAIELKKFYEKELKDVKKERKKVLSQMKSKFDSDLETIKGEMKEIVDDFRKEKTEKIARRSYSRLTQIEKSFREKIDEFDGLNDYYEEINWDDNENNIKGRQALLKELNQEVTILSLPDKNGQVKIKMGMINTKVKKERLAVYDKSLTKITKLPMAQKNGYQLYSRERMSDTLDLRGLKVEDGLDKLELFLDKASLANLTPVTIIHGHGTGAMKSAVREFLKVSPYVKDFAPGEQASGGDGVSVVNLK
ncbi:endonuclease MutS2 [bacterium]|nr:endonuclease MutS2 [bacterium]